MRPVSVYLVTDEHQQMLREVAQFLGTSDSGAMKRSLEIAHAQMRQWKKVTPNGQ